MKNILLVDDDNICNFINKKTLQLTGSAGTIDTALNGQEALGMFQNQYLSGPGAVPDLVLLDLDMPVMNGFEFLHEFNAMQFPDKSKVKIVVVSSSSHESDIKRAQGLGVQKYLNKPLNPHAALELLH